MNRSSLSRRGLISAGAVAVGATGLTAAGARAAFAASGGGPANAVWLEPSGDTSGTTDTDNLNALLTAPSAAVILAAGDFYFGTPATSTTAAVPITLSQGYQSIIGMGAYTTRCHPPTAYTPATAVSTLFQISSDRNLISGVGFFGQYGDHANEPVLYPLQGAITDNPPATAIQITGGYHTTLEDLSFGFIYGWMVNLQGTTTASGLNLCNIHGTNCAGGIWIYGANKTVGTNMIDCGTAQIGVSVANGIFSNLDALLIEDASDLTGVDLNFSCANQTPIAEQPVGHGFHLVGNVANVWFEVIDCGGYPFPTAGNGQCGLKIESDSTGSANGVHFSNAVFQTWDIGFDIEGAAADVTLDHCTFIYNRRYGGLVNSTGGGVLIESCQFGGAGIKSNGYVAESYAMYDLYMPVTTGSGGTIRGCRFNSPIVAVDAGVGVQYSIGNESAGLYRYELNEFGSGSDNYLQTPTHVLPAP